MSKTKLFNLVLLITLIMSIALGFLYLLERQKIYNNLKENSRSLIIQENNFQRQLGQEWDRNLASLLVHNNLRLYLNDYVRNPQEVPAVYTDSLAKIFADTSAYQSHLIHRVSLVNLDGQELVAAEEGKVTEQLKSWYSNDYFREALSQPNNKPLNNQFQVMKTDSYLYKTVPVFIANKKIALLIFTIRMSDVINKYQYLLTANIADQIIAVTAHGKFLLANNNETIKEDELENVFVALKQKTSSEPIVEYLQNIWSFIHNEDQGFYILLESRGDKITRNLNEEYLKLGGVFFVSSLILILIVFFSTRKIQRQQAKVETEKVVYSERSINFASVSNEIRQPLNALMGVLVTMEENSSSDQPNVYLSTAKKTATQLTELINEFTDFAKISQGNFKLQTIEFDLRTTMNDIADIMQAQAQEKGLEISCLISSDIPKRVKGDATRLRQILFNLISFSIKYTRQGEICLNLSVEKFSAEETLFRIEVSDTGNIIDQESMSQHFNLFTSDSPHFENRSTGDGLGLALSKQLINLMRGEITFSDNSLGGNTFRVSWPMQVVETAASPMISIDNLKGKKVLIIGEVELNRNMLSHALAKWGMSGGTMGDFPNVVKVLQQAQNTGKTYHACLIDISLSSMSEKAFALIRDIRTVLNAEALKIIVLTVQGVPGDAQVANELGAQAYLTKPMTREGMKEVLLRLFSSELEKPVGFITRHTLKEVKQESMSRVLLVNSDIELQKKIARLFDNNRYKLDLAQDAAAFEDAVNSNVYDMVMLDVDLPRFDVFNYVKKFRQNESTLNKALNASGTKPVRLPIIGIVAEKNDELVQRCEKNGLDNLLSKAVNKEKIQELIDTYLEPLNAPLA